MDKAIYVYYAHRLYFKGKWANLTREEYLETPDGAYIFHAHPGKWTLKGNSTFLEEYEVPTETRAAHLIESM